LTLRKLLLLALLALAPCQAHSASSVAFSWPTDWFALTDGATITVPCPGTAGVSGNYLLTVTGNNHTISLPSCSTPSSVTFRITQDSGGPYTGLSFSAGANTLNWTNKTAYVPTAAALATDDVGGVIVSSTVWDLWAAQPNMGPVSATISHVQSFSVTTGSGTGNQTTAAFTAAGTGHAILCLVSTASNTVNTVVDSASNSYTVSSGFASDPGGFFGRYAYNANISGSPTTITVNLTSSDQARVTCDEFSRSSGTLTVNATAGPTAVTAGTSVSQSITPTLTPTMLWGAILAISATNTPGAGFTSGNSNQGGHNASTEYATYVGTSATSTTWTLSASVSPVLSSIVLY
jgi:hypothetical protein